MKLVIACQKGGVGKSTLALNLLVEAIRAGYQAALVDADPQGSCLFMSAQRQRIHGQALPIVDGDGPADGWTIIDTAPHADAQLAGYFRSADLVLIPTRPAMLDLAAAADTIAAAKVHCKRVAVVLMLPTPRAQEIDEAREWVTAKGVSVAGLVHHRVDIARAAGQGLGISEFLPNHPGSPEFAEVFSYCNHINK